MGESLWREGNGEGNGGHKIVLTGLESKDFCHDGPMLAEVNLKISR